MKISEKESFQMRYLDETDGPTLTRWFSESRVNEGMSISTEAEIEGHVKIWMGYSRFKCGLTATVDGKRCGMAILFLMPYRKVAHHGMGYIVVPPKYQNEGIGTSLAKNILHLGKTYFRLERVQFEIFGQSPLLSILEKQGYYKAFQQEEYAQIKGVYVPRIVMEKRCQ